MSELTKNQQGIIDHTRKNGWFALNTMGSDFEDCEILHEEGMLTRTEAASWMGDDYIYYINEGYTNE